MACYWSVRRGRHVVLRALSGSGAWTSFVTDTQSCFAFLRANRFAVLICSSSALLFAAMFSQVVLVPPFADYILHSGPVGFGWIHASWAIGAFASAGSAPNAIKRMGLKGSIAATMFILAAGAAFATRLHSVPAAMGLFTIMGGARGISVVALNAGMMQVVPEALMGRVQNTFAMISRAVQMSLALALGCLGQRFGLTAAFALLATTYAAGAIAAGLAGRPLLTPEPTHLPKAAVAN
jgi:hypothetical protein